MIIDKKFLIQTGEVTVAEFRRFVKSLSKKERESLGKSWEQDDENELYPDNFPVSNVSLDIANQYAKWLSKQTGCNLQLPTYEQWAAAVIVYRENQTRQLLELQPINIHNQMPDYLLFNRGEWSRTPCNYDGGEILTLGYDHEPNYSITDFARPRCDPDWDNSIGFRLVKE